MQIFCVLAHTGVGELLGVPHSSCDGQVQHPTRLQQHPNFSDTLIPVFCSRVQIYRFYSLGWIQKILKRFPRHNKKQIYFIFLSCV
jgi:hypothetical protein